MAENILEYAYCFFDYTILLYFYSLLIKQDLKWKRAIIGVTFMALIQLTKDTLIDFGGWSIFIDGLLVVTLLQLYSFKISFLNVMSAMLIYSVFICSIAVYVSISIELSINVAATLVFGWERFIFNMFLKLFIVISYVLILPPFIKLRLVLSNKVNYSLFLMISLVLMMISYVYGNSIGNESVLFYVTFTLLLSICILYLVYHYCIVLKENESLNSIKHSMKLTADYTKNLEKEHGHISRIRHDMKNQLLILSDLQNNGKYEEVKHILSTLTSELDKSKQSISGNLYVDAVLRQKQEQYKDIEFRLTISLDSDFEMEGTDIISLLSNIIDNACEELRRIQANAFQLSLNGNKSKLEILEVNPCRKQVVLETDKNKESHGYGLKIIHSIVEKYDGEIVIKTEGEFRLFVMLNF